jgi:hypothetical protein
MEKTMVAGVASVPINLGIDTKSVNKEEEEGTTHDAVGASSGIVERISVCSAPDGGAKGGYI